MVFSRDSEKRSILGSQFHTDVPSTNTSTTTLSIRRSDKTIEYSRTNLKLFDVFAYMGGIIQFFLILFFFMPSFGKMLFEMQFAKQLFRSRDSKEVNFITFLKQKIYNVFSGTCLKPDWEQEEKRSTINSAVNKIMDMVLLQKRIAFLEEAITVLLDSHHLKGIYLVHNLTQEEAERCHKSHKFRDRIVYYLSKYAKDDSAGRRVDDGSEGRSSQDRELLKRSS